MLPFLPLVASLRANLVTPDAAKSQASKCLTAFGFVQPAIAASVMRSGSGSMERQWVVTWGPFSIRLGGRGELVYFRRIGNDYHLIHPAQFQSTAEAKSYLIRMSRVAGVPEAASARGVSWTRMPGLKNSGNPLGVHEYYLTMVEGRSGAAHNLSTIRCNGSDGAIDSFSLDEKARGEARVVGTFSVQ